MLSSEEAGKIIMTIRLAFPSYNVDDISAAINMYQAFFKDYTYEQVSMGLHRYIVTNKSSFAPSIGQIIDCMLINERPDELGEMEAWGLVSKAIRNSAWHSEEEYLKLPENIQKALGSSHQLNVWATDENFNESVVQSNFMRSYRTILQREKDDAKIPQYIKDYSISQNTVKEIEQWD